MKQIVKVALEFLGVREGTQAFRNLIDLYNEKVAGPHGCYKMKYTDPWCAAFVSLCAALANVSPFPFSAACQPMFEWAKKNGRFSALPCVGGLVLYDWDRDGVADHVGIIEGFDSVKIFTIEGNTSDQCARRQYSRANGSIMGYVVLDSGESSDDDTPEIPVNDAPALAAIGVLRVGSVGPFVRALQWLLVGRGFSVGRCGCDGEYGQDTRAAVVAFQALAGLDADGEAGPLTFEKLVV